MVGCSEGRLNLKYRFLNSKRIDCGFTLQCENSKGFPTPGMPSLKTEREQIYDAHFVSLYCIHIFVTGHNSDFKLGVNLTLDMVVSCRIAIIFENLFSTFLLFLQKYVAAGVLSVVKVHYILFFSCCILSGAGKKCWLGWERVWNGILLRCIPSPNYPTHTWSPFSSCWVFWVMPVYLCTGCRYKVHLVNNK